MSDTETLSRQNLKNKNARGENPSINGLQACGARVGVAFLCGYRMRPWNTSGAYDYGFYPRTTSRSHGIA